MTGGGIDGHNWRGGAEQGGPVTSPAAVNKGELQQADQHLHENFVLFLYVPTEQVGVIIGKKGAKIQYIQTATNTRVVMAANASKEWESAWFQVMVKGSPSGCYAASKIIASLVDELDDCVAQFHVNRGKHAAIIGKSGATIRRISADTNVRIFVPGRKEDGSDIQLEGEVSSVMKALALIMTAVYGAHSGGGGGKKGEHDASAAAGIGEGDKEPGEGKQVKQKKEKQQQQQAPEEAAEPEGPLLEELLMVPVRQLRLLTQNKKGSAMAVISRLTGAKITKEPKPKKDAAAAADEGAEGEKQEGQGEGGAYVVSEERLVKVHVASVDEGRLRAAVEALKRVAEGGALGEAEEALRAQGFTGSGGDGGKGSGGEKKKGKSGGKGKGKGKGGASGGAPGAPAANGPPAPAPEASSGSGPA